MNYLVVFLVACFLPLAACNKAPDQHPIQCIAAKVSIGDKQIDSVIQWNDMTGEARLLNAASFSDKSTGKQGSLIGWVPLVDLQQTLRNMPKGLIPVDATKSPEKNPTRSYHTDQTTVPGKRKSKLHTR